MSRRKKLVNNSGIPQHEIETIARILLPDILAYYESEEGQREFAEWKAHGMQLEMITRLRKSPENTEKGRQEPSLQRYFVCFGFLGPLGLDSGRLMTPFRKCVFSNFSKKTNNPNPSPITKTWFGLSLSGAPDRT